MRGQVAATEDPFGPDWSRPRPDGRALLRDVALAAAMAALGIVSVQVTYSAYPDLSLGWHDVEAYLWAAAFGVVLAVRRLWAIAALAVGSALFYGVGQRLGLIMGALGIQVAAFMCIYTGWAWARNRVALRWVTGVVFLAMGVWVAHLVGDISNLRQPPSRSWFSPVTAAAIGSILMNALYFFGALFWGLAAWRSARERARVAEQSRELDRERDRRARRAVAEERIRIARELHDVVAHHVSSIGVQAAGAGRVLDRSPERARQALGTIETSSREAVREMHQLVSMLRLDETEAGVDRSAHRGLAGLDALVAEARADGHEVTLHRTGPAFASSAAVEVSLFRVAQEALANARKHAAGAPVAVVVRHLDGEGRDPEVEVEVTDDGGVRRPPDGAKGADETGGGGWGLVGIQERASMHGGIADIGTRPEGGFRVRVRLPAGVDR